MSAREGEWRGRSLHFVAIGGAGMSGLALVAGRLGARVSGSDRAESSYLERLRRAGLEPRIGHDADAVPPQAEVVVSSAVGEDNPELARARERGQRILHRGELLAEVCALRRLIAVAGAHGKTTTAGMLVHALRGAGADPSFLLGGELRAAGEGEAANAGLGGGEWIVAEADESDGSFLRLRPEVAVVTNVELDHHAHWSSGAGLLEAFRSFAGGARGLALPGGTELSSLWGDRAPVAARGGAGDRNGDEHSLVRYGVGASEVPDGEETYRPTGFGVEAGPLELRATELEAGPAGSRFTVRLEDGGELAVTLALPGLHNVINALAALAALHLALGGGASRLRDAAAALGSFGGVARRLELKGTRSGARVYDDYAHHPTEVAATLAALRRQRPRRLIAVFQPHLYSRTKALARRFGAVLAAADEVGVLEVYAAREEPVGELAGVSGRQIAEAAAERAGGRPVWWLRDLETAERALAPRLGEGDLLVTLGAGDVSLLADRLVEPGSIPSSAGAAPPGREGS